MSEWIRKDDVLKLIYDLSDMTTADVVEVTSGKYDCVSREKVRDLLHEYMNNDDFTIGHLDDCYCEMPSLDVRENVKGEWTRHYTRPNVFKDTFWHCSVCGYKNSDSFANFDHKYCPNCGADMRGENDVRITD